MKKKNKPEYFDEMQESIRGKAARYAFWTSKILSIPLWMCCWATSEFNAVLPKDFMLYYSTALVLIPSNIFSIYNIIKNADESRLDASGIGGLIFLVVAYTLQLILNLANPSYSKNLKIFGLIIFTDLIFLYSLRIIKKRIATKNLQKDYKEHQQENDE